LGKLIVNYLKELTAAPLTTAIDNSTELAEWVIENTGKITRVVIFTFQSTCLVGAKRLTRTEIRRKAMIHCVYHYEDHQGSD
jgi:hypothetical protein